MTNREKLILMADKETFALQRCLENSPFEFICKDDSCCDEYTSCLQHIIKWLNEEAKE